MDIHLRLLEQLIALPTEDKVKLVELHNDLGLEVKDISENDSGTVFTIEVLANRGDHLSHLGIAREIAARTLTPIKKPALQENLSEQGTSIPVHNDTEKCMRYSLLEMELPDSFDIPAELRVYVEKNDERHPFVDLLNYVQMELGQPMHAFDRDKVVGEVRVTLADKDQKIEALDGETYTVPKGSILICDAEKTIAVAGVIGCANSMMTPGSTAVLVESATFDPVSVRMTARAMGISTDASYAFERGADTENVIPALQRVAYLATESDAAAEQAKICGVMSASKKVEDPDPIVLDVEHLARQLNLEKVDTNDVISRFEYLGLATELLEGGNMFRVKIPSWRRWDLESYEDLVEEYVRSIGYSEVPLQLPPLDYAAVEDDPVESFLKAVEPILLGSGFVEVMSRSYYSASDAALIEQQDPARAAKHVLLKNSQEKNYSHLKSSNIIHLTQLAEQNSRRGIQAIKAYEVGRLFQKNASHSRFEHEFDALSFLACGRFEETDWKKAPSNEELIREVSGVIQSIAEVFAIDIELCAGKSGLLHPGFQAELRCKNSAIGILGLLHPALASELDVSPNMVYAEIDIFAMLAHRAVRHYQAPSEFPSIRRDITVQLPEREFASIVSQTLMAANVEHCVAVDVVDDFRRKEENFRRVTYRITFQSHERTLEHKEVDTLVETLLSVLKEKVDLSLAQ